MEDTDGWGLFDDDDDDDSRNETPAPPLLAHTTAAAEGSGDVAEAASKRPRSGSGGGGGNGAAAAAAVASVVARAGVAAAVGGVPASEHPYFARLSCGSDGFLPGGGPRGDGDAGSSLSEAVEDLAPIACDMLIVDGARSLAASLRAAHAALRGGDAAARARAARRCAGEAWRRLRECPPSEALLHAHALAHAMLADCLGDAEGAMLHADLALLPCPDAPIAALHALAARCDARCAAGPPPPDVAADGRAWHVPRLLPSSPKVPRLTRPIGRLPCPELPIARFREQHLLPGRPVVVEGHLEAAGWAACERWADLRLWSGRHGHRSVPVELGVREADAQSAVLAAREDAEGSVRLRDFVLKYLLPANEALLPGGALERAPPGEKADEWTASPVAYMAQHLLLAQLPELRKDIAVPHYCALGELRTLNVWLGTAGTVTALHYDNDDNFLAQVAGFKYVRLYAASEAKRLYATTAPRGDGHDGDSFSPVRVEAPNLEAHPDFAEAPFEEVILGPGDMLFIPRGVWHYVRSLTTSVSVNFWF